MFGHRVPEDRLLYSPWSLLPKGTWRGRDLTRNLYCLDERWQEYTDLRPPPYLRWRTWKGTGLSSGNRGPGTEKGRDRDTGGVRTSRRSWQPGWRIESGDTETQSESVWWGRREGQFVVNRKASFKTQRYFRRGRVDSVWVLEGEDTTGSWKLSEDNNGGEGTSCQ